MYQFTFVPGNLSLFQVKKKREIKTDKIRFFEKHIDINMTSSLYGEILLTEHNVNFWFLKCRSSFLV